VIADHWCGLFDENGNGRTDGALDDLFGIERSGEETYFGGGDQISEINGERYQRPYLERLDYEGILLHNEIAIPERNRESITITKRDGGSAVYLNLSPLSYFDHSHRFSSVGETWRKLIKGIIEEAEVTPEVTATATTNGAPFHPVEIIRWDLRNGRQLVGVIMNPSRQGAIDSIGEVGGTATGTVDLQLRCRGGWKNTVNLRTGERFPEAETITLKWDPFDLVVLQRDREQSFTNPPEPSPD